ncbi:hypothetical protein N7532_005516 [Penicillium argentinense]|uniref:Uncharacterized protein n=1 Tax=Penicillium argentinense TaxID=1131581 RepID=A0A9W9FEC2_9EURO|nr:uncharacterized protein N7532_005516 [Penicillium argentinense]KAJ5098515.1 hypothetical protein N7532_005516 [Penicillium argentinense]
MVPLSDRRVNTDPERAHLALALAIVKGKPPNTTVKDYFVQIRRHIKVTKGIQMPCPEKIFDSAFFWKSAYEKSEAEQAKLLNTIYDLEQRNQSLSSKLYPTDSIAQSNKTSSTKQKDAVHTGENVGASGSATQSQRARSRASDAAMKNLGNEGNGKRAPADDEDTLATGFLRQICTLERALQKRRNEKSLTTNAVMLCKLAEHAILDTVQEEIKLRRQSNVEQHPETFSGRPTPQAVLRSVELSFQLALQALHKISNTGNIRAQCKGQIVYYLVCLFESITVTLTQYCTAMSKPIESVRRNPSQISTTSRPRRVATGRRASKLPARQPRPSPRSKSDLSEDLVNLLCNLTTSLDLAKEDDQKVVEGVFFVTLNRVGKILALYTFDGMELPTDICPTLQPPGGLAAMREEDLSLDSTQLEAKSLIKFLKRALRGGLLRTSDDSDIQAPFFGRMKDRFQKTLLQAVFGEDEPLFQEGLKRPATPPPQDPDSERVGKMTFSEWFTEELWSVIGWDMLNCVGGYR